MNNGKALSPSKWLATVTNDEDRTSGFDVFQKAYAFVEQRVLLTVNGYLAFFVKVGNNAMSRTNGDLPINLSPEDQTKIADIVYERFVKMEPTMSVIFNPEMLRQALSGLDGDGVRIDLTTTDKDFTAMIISNGDRTAVVMGMEADDSFMRHLTWYPWKPQDEPAAEPEEQETDEFD